MLKDKKLETVNRFKYLDATISNEGLKPGVLARIALSTAVWQNWNAYGQTKTSPQNQKSHSCAYPLSQSFCTLVNLGPSLLTYWSYWDATIRSSRSYTDTTSQKKITAAYELHDNQFSIVRKRKMMWYGNVTRSSGPAKTILQHMVPGGRQRDR